MGYLYKKYLIKKLSYDLRAEVVKNLYKKYLCYELRSETAMKAIIESQKVELKEVELPWNCF